MKVLVAGNLANMGYEIAKSLNESGVDAKLLMPMYPPIYGDPKFMYPDLKKTGYPIWVIMYNNKDRSFSTKNWKIHCVTETQ